MIRLSSTECIIAKLLVDSAINRRGNFCYSELSDILLNQYGIKLNAHYGLSNPLGNVACLCNELGLPLLSVRVQYKNDKNGKTASGFFDIACELKPSYKSISLTEVRSKELQLTRDCADWQPLLEYLDNNLAQLMKEKTIAEQFDEYSIEIIKRFGKGHTVDLQDIVNALVTRYGKNTNSILPADFCYNRWNNSLDEDSIAYFEYIGRGKYRVWGKNHPFNGLIFANPIKGQEHAVGYCSDGHKTIEKIPVYPDEVENHTKEYLEGKKNIVKINTYERNPAARAECIKHYGCKCFICGMNFREVYGPDFEGLIHVHHLKKISQATKEYQVDPIKDLRPVCPNCHMVLHSKQQCYSISEVQDLITRL